MIKIPISIWYKFILNILLMILIAFIFLSLSPANAESWKNNAEKAAIGYANDRTADYIQETLQDQLDTQLKVLEKKLGKDNSYVKMLRFVSTNSTELNDIAEELASGDQDKVDEARGKLAVEFGKALSIIAKEDSSGKAALDGMLENVEGIGEISTALGSAAAGDSRPVLEMLGTKFLELTPMGQVVSFYQSAYGVMEWGKNKFVDSKLEELYKEYSSGQNEELLQNQFDQAIYYPLIIRRMSELRSQREEELGDFRGELSPKLRERLLNVNGDQVVKEMISTMKARKAKEIADAAAEENRAEAKKDAETILEKLADVHALKYGRDWENLVTLDEESLKKFIESVKKLQRENKDLHINQAAWLQAYKLVYGPSSEEYREKLEQYGKWLAKKPAFQGLARVFATSGGNLFINRGNLSGRDPLGFLNCLCDKYSFMGVHSSYEPNPAGDCVWGNWGVNRGPLPKISDCKNDPCAISYGVTEMRTNKSPIEPIASGAVIREGEQIQTTSNTILAMPDGSMLLVNPYSTLTLTSLSSGKVLVNVQQGGARIISPAGGSSGVELKLGDRKIRPKGTEYTVQWDGKAGSLAVVEGSVTVTNETNATWPEVSLDAGWKLETATGMISPYNLSTDDGGLFVGIPLRDLVLDDSDPEPYGEYRAAFSKGKIPEGWIWQDPGNDAKIETPENGTLRVTVPDGNEFWDARTQAPRMLHKVTGDFDLEGELLLKSNGTDQAVSEFLMYSPGSYLGYLAKQMNRDGLGAHYQVLGGGWLHLQGMNKLVLLNEKLADGPNAPDLPVRFRLTRHGDIWKTYWSPDGVNWNISTRQEIVAPETVWVGWLFKRNAYDGLRSEPAITTLRDVRLETAPNGTMKNSDWDLVLSAGKVQADNSTVHMELDGSSLGTLYAFKGDRLVGDFDAMVRFQAENWTCQLGESRQIGLSADSLDEKTLAFIGIQEKDNVPERYMTALGINEKFLPLLWKDTSDFGGYLRILRQKGNLSTYYWSECRWVRLDKFGDGFSDPVYIRMWISNRDEAKVNARLSVDFTIEQIITGEAVGENRTPAYCSLIQSVALPEANASIDKAKELDTTTTKVCEIRGQVAGNFVDDVSNLVGDSFTWNVQNFAGFYYDIKDDIGTETLSTTLTDHKLSGDSPYGVKYTTATQSKAFKFEEWGAFNVIGFLADRYFAGYVENKDNAEKNILFIESTDENSLSNEQLQKILIDDDTEKTVTTYTPLKLEEGYELAIKSVDVDNNKVYLELSKDGSVVDSKVISPSKTDATMADKTYYYKNPQVGDQKELITIAAHFKNAFRGADQNLATVDGLWQISDTSTDVNADTQYDKMTITSVDAIAGTITMENRDNAITLSKNKDITLMPGVNIRVADNDTLRFYIYKLITEPGDYQIRGQVAGTVNSADNLDPADNSFTWNTQNFAGFYYDIRDDIGTETLSTTLTDRKLSGDSPYGVKYTTATQSKAFKFEEWGAFNVIGFLADRYFAGYVENKDNAEKNILFIESTDENSFSNEQLQKILIDEDTEKTVTSGTPLKLEEGYELAIKSVDVDNNKVYLELSKDGSVVDSKVISPSKTDATMADKTYYYKNPQVGDQKKLITIAVHFKNAFRGADQNLATVDGLWQISDAPTDVKAYTQFDKMTITSVDAIAGTIIMENKNNTIILSKNKDTILMPGVNIRVADNDTLRFYIYSEENC